MRRISDGLPNVDSEVLFHHSDLGCFQLEPLDSVWLDAKKGVLNGESQEIPGGGVTKRTGDGGKSPVWCRWELLAMLLWWW